MTKKTIPFCFSYTHFYILFLLVKDCVFFLLNLIIHEHNVFEYTTKIDKSKGGRGVKQMLTGLTKGEGGRGILTLADK